MIKRLLSTLVLVSLPSFAAETPAAPATSEPALTLHDLLVAALNANLELSAKRLEPQMQEQRTKAALGAFDPMWVAGFSYEASERPKTAQESSTSFLITSASRSPLVIDKNSRVEAGITGRLPTGASYQVISSIDRLRNIYNELEGEYVSSTTLTLTQPLLKDFGLRTNLAEVRLQRIATTASRYDLEATAQRILRDVASSYYEMVFAQENIRVKQEAVNVAESLVRENQRRLDEGRMAPIDVTLAQSRLAEAREELMLAENFLAQRRNSLLELTSDDFTDLVLTHDVAVDPQFLSREAPAVDRNAGLAAIFKHNPTYLASAELVKGEDIRVAYAQNQRWPRVDLKASIGLNGLSDVDFDSSYQNYWERDHATWSAGIVVNVPIFDRTGRARLAEAKSRKLQTLLTLKRTEVTLMSAFDTALRDIQNAADRVRLVRDSVTLADSALNAEIKRLASGLTTSYNVSQAQRDLSQARSRELATLVDLNKAIVQWQFVLGTLPEHLRVQIAAQ